MQTVSPNSPLPEIFSACIYTGTSYHNFYVLFSKYSSSSDCTIIFTLSLKTHNQKPKTQTPSVANQ